MFKYLIVKELKQFMRNIVLPAAALIFPLVVILVLPFLATMDVKNVKIGIVDNSSSTLSMRLAAKIEASTYFIMSGKESSYQKAFIDVEDDKTDIILAIGPEFEQNLLAGKSIDLMISANATNSTKAALGTSNLASIIEDFVTEVAAERGAPPTQAVISQLNLFNPSMNYRTFMLPAYMGMLIIILCSVFPALAIVSEREKGTLEQINVTPVSRSGFILAKLIPYIIVGVISLTISFVAAWLAYDFVPVGSFVIIYAGTVLMAAAMSALGLLISNFSSTFQQAAYLFFFVILTALLMGGLFTPTSSMPVWAQIISKCMPTSYYMEIMRGVYLKGSGFIHLIKPFAFLGGFTVLFSVAAVITYKKRA